MKLNKTIDEIFEIGVLIKGVFGIFEILVGILFAISGQKIIESLVVLLVRPEIAEDPTDLIASYFIKLSNNFSEGTQIFASLYLLLHGIVNLFLAIFLLKGKNWAYPASISVFGGFVIYQIYRYFHTFSPLLLVLTVFDIFVIIAIYLEYKKHGKKVVVL